MVIIGVDLGGTNVRGAVVAADGSLSRRIEHPSYATEGVERCLEALRALILEVSAGSTPRAIGIGIPGHVDPDAGMVYWAPNFGEYVGGKLRIWHDVDVLAPLAGIADTISIGNDANLAALGEYKFGCGRQSRGGLVLFTLGTGIGSGVVIGHKGASGLASAAVYLGYRGGAPEMGHVKVVTDGRLCGCESRGCLEAYCGTEGLLQTAKECGAEAGTPKELFAMASSGNAAALEAWSMFGHHLGVAIGMAINTWAPEIVALGGQIAGAWNYFADSRTKAVAKGSIKSLANPVEIKRAERFADAGILGAAELARGVLA
jgi:glucokinase